MPLFFPMRLLRALDISPERFCAVSIFFTLALTYGQFFQASTWGAACRFDLARALVEQQTISIDSYHGNTGDKALLSGRYYCDKAPLPSFIASLGIAVAYLLGGFFTGPNALSGWLATAGGIGAFFASGLITSLGGAFFFLALCDREVKLWSAWLATLFVFLGTTLFPYATLLQGHAPAAVWLFIFFYLALPFGRDPEPRHQFFSGVAASAALATEYLTGPPLLLLALFSLIKHKEMALRHISLMVAGALPGLFLLGLYHTMAFGGPFSLGYQHVALSFFQERMSSGFFGITLPDWSVSAKLLFGPFRGLLFACPLLLAAIPGIFLMSRQKRFRWDLLSILTVFLFYWLLNAGYSTWSGGWAIGPRHMVPSIPFLGLGVAYMFVRRPRTISALATLSILFMLAATAVQPEVPDEVANPLFDHLLPRFFDGDLSVGEQGFGDLLPARLTPGVPDRWDAFLLGEAVGLPGLLGVLPVLAVWIIAGTCVFFHQSRHMKNGLK